MTNTITPGSLAEKLVAAAKEKEQGKTADQKDASTVEQSKTAEQSGTSQSTEVSTTVTKSYQLPTSNCTLHFPPSAGGSVVSYDSVFTTSDPEQIKELDKSVRAGTIFYAAGSTGQRQHQPAEPVARAADRNNGTVV